MLWDPFEEMKRFRKRMKRLFGEDIFREVGVFTIDSPLLNVEEKKKEYVYTFHVPGFEKKEIEVESGEGTLTVKGKKRAKKEKKEEGYLYKEYEASSFERTVRLPIDADVSRIKAEFKNGVLTLHIPKKKVKKKSIKIH